MPDLQYEPITEDILRCYMQRGGSEEEFNRWYESELAAAEQRGAARALRDAAEVMQDDLAWVNTHRGLLVFEHESDPGISPFQWLRSRADQIEGDE